MRYQEPGARDQLPDTMRPHVSWGSSCYTPSVVMMHHDRPSTKRKGHLKLAHRQIFVDDPPCSLALFDSLAQGPSVKSVLRVFLHSIIYFIIIHGFVATTIHQNRVKSRLRFDFHMECVRNSSWVDFPVLWGVIFGPEGSFLGSWMTSLGIQ